MLLKFNTLVPTFVLCACMAACISAPNKQHSEVENSVDSSSLDTSDSGNAMIQKPDSQIAINKIEAVAKIPPTPIPTIRVIADEEIADEGPPVTVVMYPPKDIMRVDVMDRDEPTKIQGNRYPEPNKFILVDNEPEILNLEEIKQKIGYPIMAKDLEIEGTVIAKVLVDNTGKYIKHVFSRAVDIYLTKAVNDQISNLKFKPATKDGVPVAYWLTIPFKFVL